MQQQSQRVLTNADNFSHTRRPHTKSRRGCRNCKLRRVKCDETKPKCQKCSNFGVTCNYDRKAADLQTTYDDVASIQWVHVTNQPITIQKEKQQSSPQLPASLNPTSREALRQVFQSTAFQLSRQDADRLHRFATRTVLTIGSIATGNIYQNAIPLLIHSHPYLMHVVQTFTAIHDRYLSPTPSHAHTTTEVHHWALAASLFNLALSGPIHPDDRDALWATCALLGAIAISSVEATTPSEAWPLSTSSQALEWIRMSTGKSAIWVVTNPLRPDSIFASLGRDSTLQFLVSRAPYRGIDDVPAVFVDLYELDENSTEENNAYYRAVKILSPLLDIDCDRAYLVRFLSFISHLQSSYYKLLSARDPRAILLLAFWYGKVMYSAWWLERRARLECQSVCLYLEGLELKGKEKGITRLLAWPKMRCGLLEVDEPLRMEVELDWKSILV